MEKMPHRLFPEQAPHCFAGHALLLTVNRQKMY
jgi:hypothetical protein